MTVHGVAQKCRRRARFCSLAFLAGGMITWAISGQWPRAVQAVQIFRGGGRGREHFPRRHDRSCRSAGAQPADRRSGGTDRRAAAAADTARRQGHASRRNAVSRGVADPASHGPAPGHAEIGDRRDSGHGAARHRRQSRRPAGRRHCRAFQVRVAAGQADLFRRRQRFACHPRAIACARSCAGVRGRAGVGALATSDLFPAAFPDRQGRRRSSRSRTSRSRISSAYR